MGRKTNTAVLAFLLLAGLSGLGSFAVGDPTGWFVALSHGAFGLGLLLLAPWKSLIVRKGMSRGRRGRWASVLLLALVTASIMFGTLHSTGLVRTLGPVTSMQLHVGAALLAVPAVGWHVIARPQRIHKADLTRRNLLKAGAALAGSAGLYGLVEGGLRLAALPGAKRRFTGSHRSDLIVTSWLNDRVPHIDANDWTLTIGEKQWRYEELAAFEDRLDATLDCTGGWYSNQQWAGARLNRLLDVHGTDGRSILVSSVTGYSRRFPLSDLDSLLLATKLAGSRLDPGHGFPARLVAPGRRGFWWVKWISEIRLDGRPAWLQSPFPLT